MDGARLRDWARLAKNGRVGGGTGSVVAFGDARSAVWRRTLANPLGSPIRFGFLGFALGGIAGVLLGRWGLRDSHMYIAVAVASGVGALGSQLAAEHRGAWKGSLMCWIVGSMLGCVLIYLTDNGHFTPERGVYQISLALTCVPSLVGAALLWGEGAPPSDKTKVLGPC